MYYWHLWLSCIHFSWYGDLITLIILCPVVRGLNGYYVTVSQYASWMTPICLYPIIHVLNIWICLCPVIQDLNNFHESVPCNIGIKCLWFVYVKCIGTEWKQCVEVRYHCNIMPIMCLCPITWDWLTNMIPSPKIWGRNNVQVSVSHKIGQNDCHESLSQYMKTAWLCCICVL